MSSIRTSSGVPPGDAIRHAHAPLVEQDQAAELAEALAVPPERRQLPVDVQVRERALDVDEVDRAVADDAIRDIDVPARRESNLGHIRIIAADV